MNKYEEVVKILEKNICEINEELQKCTKYEEKYDLLIIKNEFIKLKESYERLSHM